jgi:hypothetical protein
MVQIFQLKKVGNGYVGAQINIESIFINGVYNGPPVSERYTFLIKKHF